HSCNDWNKQRSGNCHADKSARYRQQPSSAARQQCVVGSVRPGYFHQQSVGCNHQKGGAMRGGHFALRVRRLLHYPLDFPFMAQANRAGAYARCVAMLAFAAKFKLDELSKELSQVKESLKPRRI